MKTPMRRTLWLIGGVLLAGSAVSRAADLRDTIDVVKPGVVMVGSYQKTASPQFVLRGTGFAVTRNLVATNAHVVAANPALAESRSLVVRFRDASGGDKVVAATLHASDPAHDLALLKVEELPIPVLKIGNSARVREGSAVAFTGFPIGGVLGFSPVTHRGIVSAITSIAPPAPNAQSLNPRQAKAIRAGAFAVFQLDATAYPGNSGGPMFDPETGAVIGVVNMVFVKGTKEAALSHPSGISYAIPAEYLARMLSDLSEYLTPPTQGTLPP